MADNPFLKKQSNPFLKSDSPIPDITEAPKQEEKTSAAGTFLREGIMAAPATAVGIGVGEAAATAAAPAGPIVAAGASIIAGGAAALATSYFGEEAIDAIEQSSPEAKKLLQLLNADKATREAGRKEHEYSALSGQLASGGPFMSTAAKSVAQRAVGGTIQAGVGAGTRAAMGEEQDPVKSAMEFAGGAAMPGSLNKVGKKIPGVAKEPPPKLVETAFQTPKGEIIKNGPKHSDDLKTNHPDWKQGFVDDKGQFHDREQAIGVAKEAKQIPEDHQLENPEGEQPGLHSGDMRKAGVDEFKLEPDKIPIPKTHGELDDALHKVTTFETKDTSEHVTKYKENEKAGITSEHQEQAFLAREDGKPVEGPLGETLAKLDNENKSLVEKIRTLGGDIGAEFLSGQSRIRVFGGTENRFGRMIKELFANKMPFNEKVAEQANAAMERNVFQLDDGTVIEVARNPDKKSTEVFQWKQGSKSKYIFHDSEKFNVGDKLANGRTVVDAKVPAIEHHTPYRYLKNAEASARIANMALRKQARDLEFLENLKQSDLFKDVARGPETPIKDLPAGWKTPASIDKIPQLRGYVFDPKTAAIIEDFAKVWDNNLMMKLTNQIVKNLMLNPLPHIFNEMMHVYNARGLSGWVAPSRLYSFGVTSKQAFRDVGMQTQFYRDIMREGGSILGADPRNHYFDELLHTTGKELFDNPEAQKGLTSLAKKLGTTVGDLYNGLSKKSQQAMWFSRDVLYVQMVREVMRDGEKSGKSLELKDAIKEVERHMPNYRMPSEVLGSRSIAQVLKNPNLSLFSRYHYGMVKSIAETLKDLDPRNIKSAEGREKLRDGIDTALAIGVALTAMYPLMDKMAEAVFGEGAEQRRAGPYHLIQAAIDNASGKKDVSALLWPVFTFNPVVMNALQVLLNKNFFTGKPLYHPEDDIDQIAADIGTHAVKQIPQASPLMAGGGENWAARQVDIKTQTPEQRAKGRKAQELRIRNQKSRNKQRDQGTYKP